MAEPTTRMRDCIASIVMAAGRGSRMKGFDGNKTLLPLVPDQSPFQGREPILIHVLQSLPPGPKAVVVNYQKEAVMEAARGWNPIYCHQPVLNGTGGALLAARDFIRGLDSDGVIVTMGDVPLVRRDTYLRLVNELRAVPMAVLGFEPADKRQYGVLVMNGNRVARITEWKYWSNLPEEARKSLKICNSGIYAARKGILLHYLEKLASMPHRVKKEIGGQWVQVEEYFITDLVESMTGDGVEVGCVLAEDEWEVMGVDDLSALRNAQRLYRERFL